jgi:type I restriction enzyme R subunit
MEKRERNVRLLDPENVEANQFHVTDEFTFSNGTPPDSRADIVFFVNGVPVLIVETKHAMALDGIAQALLLAPQSARGSCGVLPYSAAQRFWLTAS